MSKKKKSTPVVEKVEEKENVAEEELTIFLQVNRHKDIVSRARFYRAQTYYFQGYFREAIKEFLNCTDTLNPRTKKWISSCLLKMSL